MKRLTEASDRLQESFCYVGLCKDYRVQEMDDDALHTLLLRLSMSPLPSEFEHLSDREQRGLRKSIADVLLLRDGFDIKTQAEMARDEDVIRPANGNS